MDLEIGTKTACPFTNLQTLAMYIMYLATKLLAGAVFRQRLSTTVGSLKRVGAVLVGAW